MQALSKPGIATSLLNAVFFSLVMFGVSFLPIRSVSGTFIYYFAIVAATLFAMSDDQRQLRSLILASLACGLVLAVTVTWPLADPIRSLLFFMWVICFFAVISYVSVAHATRSLVPEYSALFKSVYINFVSIVFMYVLLFVIFIVLDIWGSVFVYLDVRFFEKLFVNQHFVYSFYSFMAVLCMYLIRTSPKTITVSYKFLLVMLRVLGLLLIFVGALFLIVWAGKGFFFADYTNNVYMTSPVAFTAYGFFALVSMNACWLEPNKTVHLRKKLWLVASSLICLGVIFALIGDWQYVYFQKALAHRLQGHFVLVNKGNVLDYYANLLITVYFVVYLIGLILARREFLVTHLPKINLVMFYVMIISFILINNPLTKALIHVKPMLID